MKTEKERAFADGRRGEGIKTTAPTALPVQAFFYFLEVM